MTSQFPALDTILGDRTPSVSPFPSFVSPNDTLGGLTPSPTGNAISDAVYPAIAAIARPVPAAIRGMPTATRNGLGARRSLAPVFALIVNAPRVPKPPVAEDLLPRLGPDARIGTQLAFDAENYGDRAGEVAELQELLVAALQGQIERTAEGVSGSFVVKDADGGAKLCVKPALALRGGVFSPIADRPFWSIPRGLAIEAMNEVVTKLLFPEFTQVPTTFWSKKSSEIFPNQLDNGEDLGLFAHEMSCQAWVANMTPMTAYMGIQPGPQANELISGILPDLKNAIIFALLSGDPDRNAGNVGITRDERGSYHLVAIDSGGVGNPGYGHMGNAHFWLQTKTSLVEQLNPHLKVPITEEKFNLICEDKEWTARKNKVLEMFPTYFPPSLLTMDALRLFTRQAIEAKLTYYQLGALLTGDGPDLSIMNKLFLKVWRHHSEKPNPFTRIDDLDSREEFLSTFNRLAARVIAVLKKDDTEGTKSAEEIQEFPDFRGNDLDKL